MHSITLAVLGLCAGWVVAGCDGGSSGGGGAPATSPTAAFGLEQRQIVSGLALPTSSSSGGSSGGGTLAPRQAFTRISFAQPIGITYLPDGSDRLVVIEQRGRALVFANDDAVSTSSVFLDISARVTSGGEEGLLGIAFDPDYRTSGYVYVHYSASGPRRSVISRFSTIATDRADPSSEVVLLEVNQPFSNHNGGMLAFGADRMLYVALGDGGSGGDPQGHGQNTQTLLGSILRIDPHGGTPYGIPADNPLVGQTGRDEIWAWGLRNPWRFSFDRQTGELYVGDVGQSTAEEVGLAARGDNLGWKVFEGAGAFDNPGGLSAASFRQPLVSYGRSLGATVVGGHVYRGTQGPALAGTYVYGDFVSGRVWALTRDSSGAVATNVQIGQIKSVTSFGETEGGELLAVSYDGSVWRIDASGGAPAPSSPSAFPRRLSDTGLFTNVQTLEPSAGVIEYEVNVSFWSDGAHKRRWLALPGSSQIGFSRDGDWTFPLGTVAVKHFELDTSSGRQRIETRVLYQSNANTWTGLSYRWNSAQTDADLVDAAGANVSVSPSNGAAFTYRIPSRNECARCHTAAAGHVLGLDTRQLNRTFAYSNGVTDNQLRAFDHVGLFSSSPGDAGALPSHPQLSDAGASDEARARAYLAVNCAQCHLPGGPAPGGLDLRATTANGATNLLDVAPSEGDLGLTNARRVAPGSKERSVLWERLRRSDATRMPPIGRAVTDSGAVDLIGRWIDGL
ncbi:MAG TPA: hypothetical protein DEA08_37835, partial [Planctomycetes bacterium]|nr:hypothetical protein [Planctomycetota bacterium]